MPKHVAALTNFCISLYLIIAQLLVYMYMCVCVYIYIYIYIYIYSFIHSFSSLSYDRSKASSKASSPHSAIQSFLFQMRVSSTFFKVIQ